MRGVNLFSERQCTRQKSTLHRGLPICVYGMQVETCTLRVLRIRLYQLLSEHMPTSRPNQSILVHPRRRTTPPMESW